ncbi:hypothetical protein H0E87_007585 [Populus deltoides]|uniref:Transmembrane protein n=1 Tax=Populus deltoides TaxID=3696 RepID=A0A8T2ZBS0_POPDE|nr:hypothetical protein H0E87_007585 [Populus deltoides]
MDIALLRESYYNNSESSLTILEKRKRQRRQRQPQQQNLVDSIVFKVPSSSWMGDDSVADWSWILQYLSDTEEDLVTENAFFTADWSAEADDETDELLLSFAPNPTTTLFSSSSSSTESESWVVVSVLIMFFLVLSWSPTILLVSWGSLWDFVGSGNANERSEKSMDLDLAVPKILILE